MPCICYGAISGQEEYDDFLTSDEGKQLLSDMKEIANRIKKVPIHEECFPIEFRQMWVKCLLHMLVGCDEHGRPKID